MKRLASHNLLLLNSPPLVLQKELAVALGLESAIVIQQIHYWLEINRKADKNLHDGHHWTYNTYEQWRRQFPFWSLSKVKRIFAALVDAGLIVSARFNNTPMDRTLWYRIDYENLSKTVEAQQNRPLVQIDTMDSVNLTPCNITETNQRIGATPQIDESAYFNHVQAWDEIQFEKRRKAEQAESEQLWEQAQA